MPLYSEVQRTNEESSRPIEVSSDYDILDNDRVGAVIMNTGSTNKTSKLPVLANNQGREITFCKTGTGVYNIDGNGATINGSTDINITDNGSSMRVKGFPNEWRIV